MKELTFQTLIPGCSIHDFHQIALSDEQAISKFHREVNKDETVAVTPWTSGQRVVEFILAMSIPKSVQSFIGAGPIRIKERQTVTWKNEHSLEIVSEPEVQVSYAKSLVTRAELAVTGSSQGVSIDVKVVVNASVPWPMTSTIEALMADQARKTVGQYVEWIGKYVEAALEDINNMRAAQQQAAESVALLPELEQQQQQQLELQAVGPPTPPESTIAAAAAAALHPQAAVAAAAAVATPGAAPGAAAVTALVPRQAAAAAVPVAYRAAAAAVAPQPVDVFYDADEVVPGSTLDLLMRELREAKEAREQTNRLLLSIRETMQHVDYALNRELAFQEGVRHAQLVAGSSSSFSWFLSIASTAALASTCTAYLLLRRNALH